MKRHWQYLKYVLRHKWYVFVECLKLGVPIWFAVFHDWSKFLPGEWRPYADYFYGDEKPAASYNRGALAGMGIFPFTREEVEAAFDVAWLKHQKRNRHHWQYWLLTPDNPRPNFSLQSHDGGMSHLHIRSVHGEDAAVIYDHALNLNEIMGWQVSGNVINRLEADLNNTPIPLPMPDVYRREMLADWRGAGRAVGKPDTRSWYIANCRNIVLHPETRQWIEAQLGV